MMLILWFLIVAKKVCVLLSSLRVVCESRLGASGLNWCTFNLSSVSTLAADFAIEGCQSARGRAFVTSRGVLHLFYFGKALRNAARAKVVFFFLRKELSNLNRSWQSSRYNCLLLFFYRYCYCLLTLRLDICANFCTNFDCGRTFV